MKIGTSTLFEVCIDLWRVNIVVTYGANKKFFKKAFKDQPKEHKKKLNLIKNKFKQVQKERCSAMYNYNPSKDIHYIHIKPQDDMFELIHVVSHECLHATFNILTLRGVEYSIKSEETYTYLQGYLLEQILRQILQEDAP